MPKELEIGLISAEDLTKIQESAKVTQAERNLIKERCQEWVKLREWYDKAEKLQEQGESEITVPIEVFLYAKQVPKNVEEFWHKAIYNRLKTSS